MCVYVCVCACKWHPEVVIFVQANSAHIWCSSPGDLAGHLAGVVGDVEEVDDFAKNDVLAFRQAAVWGVANPACLLSSPRGVETPRARAGT